MGLKKNFIIGCGIAATCPALADLLIALFLVFVAIIVNLCWIDSVFWKPKREKARYEQECKEALERMQKHEEYLHSQEYLNKVEEERKRKERFEMFEREAEENRKKNRLNW